MTKAFEPAYLEMLNASELHRRVSLAYDQLSSCSLCGWECKVDRRSGKLGVCRTGEVARISSYGPHLGEENPLRGWRGSGTIFLTRCNLRCQFCQNHAISQTDDGELVEPEALAGVMLELQAYGCHNINLVSPTHVVPQILAAVLIAAQAGLRLPLVYNTGGYDSAGALALLDGIVDIYMPDMKYANPQVALHYSKIRRYPEINQAAVREMHRQVGDLIMDDRGLAQRGLLVRHLILPNGLAGTEVIMRFLAEEISKNTYINIMDQYRPAYQTQHYLRLNRSIKPEEYASAVEIAHSTGLFRLDR
jgi:putative pyruvate formate lyase activating enzyme